MGRQVDSRVGASSCMFFAPKTREIVSPTCRVPSLPLSVSVEDKEKEL